MFRPVNRHMLVKNGILTQIPLIKKNVKHHCEVRPEVNTEIADDLSNLFLLKLWYLCIKKGWG